MTPFGGGNMNGNVTSFIPLHIVGEILMRADTQTLFQCAFVCKYWSILITNPDFISRSLDRADSRNHILFLKVCHCKKSRVLESLTNGDEGIHFPYCPSPATYSLHYDNDRFDLFRTMESPPIDDFKGTEVIDVSNGLVCLANKLPFKLILWNPTIQKYAWIPFPMSWYEVRSNIGFGFDRSSNDIKVVNLVYYPDEYNAFPTNFDSVWVFSYNAWSWKRLTCNIPPLWFVSRVTPCVSLNGVLYWVCINNGYQFILTFNLTHEVFGKILFPDDARHSALSTIVTTGDSLLLIQKEETYEGDQDEVASNFFFIWIMKQYGNHESWANIFSTTTKIDDDLVLGARKNGDLLLDMGGGEILTYNPTTPTYFFEKAIENSVFFRYYTESLYLLEKEGEINSY